MTVWFQGCVTSVQSHGDRETECHFTFVNTSYVYLYWYHQWLNEFLYLVSLINRKLDAFTAQLVTQYEIQWLLKRPCLLSHDLSASPQVVLSRLWLLSLIYLTLLTKRVSPFNGLSLFGSFCVNVSWVCLTSPLICCSHFIPSNLLILFSLCLYSQFFSGLPSKHLILMFLAKQNC